MAKQFGFQLKLVNPCTENWDNMTAQEQGRHCDSCNKTVIDFTLFTDKQLIDFFKKATDGICGRATKDQLQRQIVYTEQSKHPLLSKFVFGTTLLAGLTTAATAQQATKDAKHTHHSGHKKHTATLGIEAINPPIVEEIPFVPEVSTYEKAVAEEECKNEDLVGYMGGIAMIGISQGNFYTDGTDNAITDYVESRGIEQAVKPNSALNTRR